ncbi:unnamed protein product [Lupinus luteus]|uniref:Uncharacterized protein n=1 Tax=Lupinus luteus TaxID=3873 RepID=A0AAV1XRC1_LUPLU
MTIYWGAAVLYKDNNQTLSKSKDIPPVNRTLNGPDKWMNVLCKKLVTWWQWVAVGKIPLMPSKGKMMMQVCLIHLWVQVNHPEPAIFRIFFMYFVFKVLYETTLVFEIL